MRSFCNNCGVEHEESTTGIPYCTKNREAVFSRKTEIGTAWVARDKDGDVYTYGEIPKLNSLWWASTDYPTDLIRVEWLPGVPWDESCRKVKLFAEVIEDEP